jgi:hypothetical protein
MVVLAESQRAARPPALFEVRARPVLTKLAGMCANCATGSLSILDCGVPLIDAPSVCAQTRARNGGMIRCATQKPGSDLSRSDSILGGLHHEYWTERRAA